MGNAGADKEPSFRLRHEAGLTSGDVVDLRVGRHQFGPSPAGARPGLDAPGAGAPVLAFEIDVRLDQSGDVVDLVPHTDNASQATTLTVDGRVVDGVTQVRPGEVIGIGPDAFVLEEAGHDPVVRGTIGPCLNRIVVPASPGLRLPPAFEMPITLALLLVALLVVAFVDLGYWLVLIPTTVLVAIAAWRQRRLQRRYVHDRAEHESLRFERFRSDLEDAARHETAQRREGAITPHQVLMAARQGRCLAPDRPIAIALGTATWHPELDERGPVDQAMRNLLANCSSLPAVPVAVDPTKTLLGIVGPRQATLAVARHLLAAATQRVTPVRFEGDIGEAATWQPLLALQSRDPNSVSLGVIDGGPPAQRPVAGIVLADSEEHLACLPDLLMSLQRDGVVTVTVPSSGLSTEGLMPIGISHARLSELAALRHQVMVERRGTQRTCLQLRDPAQPIHGPVLFATSKMTEELGALVTLMLDVLAATPGTRVVVLDAEDEGLSGLRHLPQLAGYASADADVVSLLEALTSDDLPLLPVLVLARGLGVRAARWRHTEHEHLTGRLLQLARSRQLFLAAAEPPESSMPAANVRRFPVRILSRTDHLMLLAPDGQQRLPRRRLTPTDVVMIAKALTSRAMSSDTRRPR